MRSYQTMKKNSGFPNQKDYSCHTSVVSGKKAAAAMPAKKTDTNQGSRHTFWELHWAKLCQVGKEWQSTKEKDSFEEEEEEEEDNSEEGEVGLARAQRRDILKLLCQLGMVTECLLWPKAGAWPGDLEGSAAKVACDSGNASTEVHGRGPSSNLTVLQPDLTRRTVPTHLDPLRSSATHEHVLLLTGGPEPPTHTSARPHPHWGWGVGGVRKWIALVGGFDGFQDCCPDLCSEGPAPVLPPFGAENSSSDLRVPIYDQGGPVEILPFLYLGSCSHSSDLQGLRACGITAVLNVSSSCPNHFEGLLRYKSIPVEDNQMAEISVWFQEAIGFIDSVKNSGGRVLVHCQAGISRSATICLAYLIQSRRVRLDEAFDFVKQRRGVISPNFSFMGQLLQFETQVLCH
ncbi:Dual specificity protein phosphatase 2 [Fukomys damarensis]|uniref:Dual specificity protein phosphatase 2 n=1 Tax=Fukomys damarensis TaxID=885580 RepID=A0A091DX09_FUKDA|nr:Dual specificity protein phosphatase 2 [Fukomys damarensis]